MAVETDADRLTFLSTDEFAVTVTYTPAGLSARLITAIFDNGHIAVDINGDVTVSSRIPRLTCRTSDLVNGGTVGGEDDGTVDLFVVDGDSYAGRDVMPDGTGISVVVLEAL